jgi:hypothetical protein
MDDYISRKDAVEWFMAFIHMDENAISADTVVTDLKYAIPAADVEPVRHGIWDGKTLSTFLSLDHTGAPIYGHSPVYVCSCCGRYSILQTNYCPHCGAKMNGGVV